MATATKTACASDSRRRSTPLAAPGQQIVEVSCPSFEYALAAYYLILPAEASSNLAKFDGVRFGLRVERETIERTMAATRAAGFGDEVKRRVILGTYALSAGYYDAYYGSAQRVRTLIQRDFNAAFEQADVLVSPTTPTTPFKLGERIDDPLAMYLNDVATIPANLAGIPGMSLARGPRARGRAAGWLPDSGSRPRGRAAVSRWRRRRGAADAQLGRPLDRAGPRAGGVKVSELTYSDAVRDFDPVFGIEVHVELNTRTKMFCGCLNEFGGEPNTHVCPVCLGLPGSMPVTNGKAVESAIRLGLALGCEIRESSRFARKNYFYPDLSKDYQISQYDEPTCFEGSVDVVLDDGTVVTIAIERAHMEEDAGKNTHVGGSGGIQGADYSLVDYNRGGVPLVEIVTKTIEGMGDRTAEVARAYVATIRDIVRGLGISDGRMEQGSLRADVNLSLRPKAADGEDQSAVPFGKRSETKNVNSLRAVERSIHHEAARQAELLLAGKPVVQETRHWHEDTNSTTPGRSKEEAEDYRYFPEPDLLPVEPSRAWVEQLRATIPEHPAKLRARLREEWGYSELEMRDVIAADALTLIADTVAAGASPQAARKWWMGELARTANEREVTHPGPARHARGHRGAAGPRRCRHHQRQAGPPGARGRARGRGFARRGGRGSRAGRRVRRLRARGRRRRGARRSARRARQDPRGQACRRPAPSWARS